MTEPGYMFDQELDRGKATRSMCITGGCADVRLLYDPTRSNEQHRWDRPWQRDSEASPKAGRMLRQQQVLDNKAQPSSQNAVQCGNRSSVWLKVELPVILIGPQSHQG